MREWKNKAQEKTADRNTEKQAKYKHRLEESVETVEDTYKDGEKKSKLQIWCAVAPTGWTGCRRRGQIKQNSTLIVKLS